MKSPKPPTPDRPADEDEGVLLQTLKGIAQDECWNSEADDCHCAVCCATWAIKQVEAWRFQAALSERVTNGFHPGEARMVESFRKAMMPEPDRMLATILKDREHYVTRRDWYVAVSVVQWLATNVGSLVLEGAGYKYTKYDEDRRCRDEKLPPSLCDTTCDSCADEDHNGRTYCGFCGRRIRPALEAAS